MKSTDLTIPTGAVSTPAASRWRSVVLRYFLAAASFVLVLLLDIWVNRAFNLKLDPTLLILSIMIASAWYLGRGPGLLVAFAFELAIDYFARPHTFGAWVVVLNRTLLFASVVWFASSRRGAERRLRQQREWLQVTLSSIGDAVIATDLDGSINFINPAAEALTGWTTAQAAGQPLAEVFRLRDDATHEDAASGALSVIKQGNGDKGFANHTVLVTRDGGEVPVEEHATPIRDADGNAVGVIVVFRDVSERRRADEEREQLLERERAARGEAEASDRLKDEFLATVSHELRTPLTSILGWASILNNHGARTEDELRSGLGSIERNARAQAQIVGDILDVSRIITGKLHIDPRPIELAALIQSAVDTMRPAAQAKAIRLSTSLDPTAGFVLGDPARVQQIVWNLVSNAIKFTPKNGSVEVRLARVGQYVEVSAKDDGMGISPQFLPHVFERFRQADSSKTRTHGGLGLGLAIVRHLVELHGGTVTAESAGEGRGALFTVRLPRATVIASSGAAAHELSPAAGASLIAAGAPDLSALRVLVVDDEPDTLDFLRTALSQYGAEVFTAASSAEALSALPRWKPDVLVSDLGMPREDGFALIGKVRALTSDQCGDIPAAALTAYVRDEDRARALDAGYQAHVPKPVDPSALARVVAKLAGRN
ncbi:MAG: ATP-binding protein [Pyrinomonadaceae bacterium]